MNTGLFTSQYVYPRASNVVRNPPLGKLEASGSPLISILPEKRANGSPFMSGSKKLSCFSAVPPVIGWNQCVK